VLAIALLLGSSSVQLGRGGRDAEREINPLPDLTGEQRKMANTERQAALKRDTDRLLQLATDLKLQVDRSNENVLSVDVMKKAEEIEKLAKSVKEKMRGNL